VVEEVEGERQEELQEEEEATVAVVVLAVEEVAVSVLEEVVVLVAEVVVDLRPEVLRGVVSVAVEEDKHTFYFKVHGVRVTRTALSESVFVRHG